MTREFSKLYYVTYERFVEMGGQLCMHVMKCVSILVPENVGLERCDSGRGPLGC